MDLIKCHLQYKMEDREPLSGFQFSIILLYTVVCWYIFKKWLCQLHLHCHTIPLAMEQLIDVQGILSQFFCQSAWKIAEN